MIANRGTEMFPSLITRETPLKSSGRRRRIPAGRLPQENKKEALVKDAEKLGTLGPIDEDANWSSHSGEQRGVPSTNQALSCHMTQQSHF